MGSFADLKVVASTMKELAPSYITSEMSDAEIQAIKFVIAKNDLKKDLCDAHNFLYSDTSNMTELDSITTRWSDELKIALAYKVLEWFFEDIQEGVESKTYVKWKHFQKLYAGEKDNFKRYTVASEKGTKTMMVRRG